MIILFGEGARVAQHDTIKRGMMKLAALDEAAGTAYRTDDGNVQL